MSDRGAAMLTIGLVAFLIMGANFLRQDGRYATILASDVPELAPSDAQYWTGAANAQLTAEKNLGALGTGLVLNTSGVPSAYAGSSCTNQFPRSTNASGAWTCASVATTDISNNAITGALIRDSAAVSVIGRSANSSGDPADIAADSNGQVLRRAGNVVGFGTDIPGFIEISGGGKFSRGASASNYALYVAHTGGVGTYYGVQISAGLNTDGGATNSVYINANTANDSAQVGYIENTAAGTFQLTTTSDGRLKTDIAPTKIDGLSAVRQLQVREYRKRGNPTLTAAGMIAQEVQVVVPQAVSEHPESHMLGIAYTALVPVLIKAVQEQQELIDFLDDRIAALEATPLSAPAVHPR